MQHVPSCAHNIGMIRSPIDTLWLVLPAIAEAVDEQHLGQDDAIERLTEMLGDAASDARVQVTLERLKRASDELAFRLMLG